jgi:DHA1 family multidrug resistance protein-like MFS transporter
MPVWKRTLWSTALAQMLCIVGFNFVLPFLPLFVQQLGVHGQTNITLWAGLLAGGSAICMAVSSPIWECWPTGMAERLCWCAPPSRPQC